MSQQSASPSTATEGVEQCRNFAWIDQIEHLPQEWALCAVGQQKRPYHPDNERGAGWQHSGLERSRFGSLNGRLAGVGLLLGPLSSGLIAIDHDGHSADGKIEELSGLSIQEALPITVGFTSQRDGRYQLLYKVPEELWGAIKTRQYSTGVMVAGADGKPKGEAVELRWSGAQSVILGAHPDTSGYRWMEGRSPWEVAIAPVPDWVMMAARDETPEHIFEPRTEWRIERPLETPIPLVNLVTKKHQSYIAQGVGEGERNKAGAAIARDLIGCEQWAQASGVYFEGYAEPLFWQFARNSGLGEREAQTIWRSATKDNPSPSCSDDGLQKVVKGWERKNKPKMAPVINGNGKKPVDAVGFEPLVGSGEVEEPSSLDKREEVQVNPGELSKTRAKIIEYLSKEKNPLTKIYAQGGNEQWLSRILMTGQRVDCYERLNVDKLTQVLNDKFKFFTGSKEKPKTVNCPQEIAKNIHSASRWPGMPILKGIIKLPVLRADGSVTLKSGYDEESEYLLDFDPKKFTLKTKPTQQNAFKSLESLKNLLCECAFAKEKDRSGALAMLLTAVSRNFYEYAPLFAISANTPGAGKGALTQVATILATGSIDSGMTTFNPEEVEFKKALLSTLQRGSPVVSFDNIDRRHELGGANLESALTSPTFSGRMLGTNEMASFPTKVLWLANGNRLRLSLDMSRRTILINLDAKDENILEKEYKRNLIPFVMKNRGQIVSDCLTILQAFLTEKPDVPIKPLNGYIEWSLLIRNSLMWLGVPDPVPTSEEIFSLDGIDEQRSDLANLLSVWYSQNQTTPITAKAMIQDTREMPLIQSVLSDVASDKKGMVSAKQLGYYLRSNCGIRIGNKRFMKSEKKGEDGIQWQIEVLADTPTPDDASIVSSLAGVSSVSQSIATYTSGDIPDDTDDRSLHHMRKNREEDRMLIE
jgi:putative DNA primase/helicase